MVLGALLSVAVAIFLLVAALLPGGGPPLAALSLVADAIAGTCIALSLRSRRRRRRNVASGHLLSGHLSASGHLPNGPDQSGRRPGPLSGVLPSGHFPPGAPPRA
jgi:hypothetical protein